MKHLMRYEGYSSNQRLDDLLDKISKFGMSALSKAEKEFLDSHKFNQQELHHVNLAKKEMDSVFEDGSGHFRFEYQETEDYGDEIHYIGTLYVPDLELETGQRIDGILYGKIIFYQRSGQISPEFFSTEVDSLSGDHYDVFEFCNGLEYELDSFLDYVVGEL